MAGKWKLVPVEPTPEMILAGWNVTAGEDRLARERYDDVVAAAPEAPLSIQVSEAAALLYGLWQEGAFSECADGAALDALDDHPDDAMAVIEAWLMAVKGRPRTEGNSNGK